MHKRKVTSKLQHSAVNFEKLYLSIFFRCLRRSLGWVCVSQVLISSRALTQQKHLCSWPLSSFPALTVPPTTWKEPLNAANSETASVCVLRWRVLTRKKEWKLRERSTGYKTWGKKHKRPSSLFFFVSCQIWQVITPYITTHARQSALQLDRHKLKVRGKK